MQSICNRTKHPRLRAPFPHKLRPTPLCPSPSAPTPNCPCCPGLVLERNEVIALFNWLERLAKAVEVVRELSLQVG